MDSEKNKKFFSIAAPPPSTCGKGGGGTSQKCRRNILGGKCAVLAICVRTQIDFYITGCIDTPPNNKTRLKRFICLHNGHHARKRNMNTAKTVYLCNV